jgi:hypothetical protein
LRKVEQTNKALLQRLEQIEQVQRKVEDVQRSSRKTPRKRRRTSEEDEEAMLLAKTVKRRGTYDDCPVTRRCC